MFPTLRRVLGVVVAGVLGSLLSGAAMATLVTQTLVHAGGSTWTASFSVANDGSPDAIESFTIYLSVGQASNLAMAGSPPGWDSLVVQPDPALGADGFFDSLASADGIADGSSLGGFTVRFDWADPAGPSALRFTINDPVTFDSLEVGNVEPNTGGGTVPQPATLLLVVAGAAALAAHRREKRRAFSALRLCRHGRTKGVRK